MPWRSVLIVSMFLVALVANGAMLWYERIDPPDEVIELTDNIRDVTYTYLPTKRRENFSRMGLGDKVDAALGVAERTDKSRARIRAVMVESADEITFALCEGQDDLLPPRYAALRLLVQQDDQGVRETIDGARVTAFYTQDWVELSLIDQIYPYMELRENRADNSTAIGVAGILANQEQLVLDDEGVFDPGFGGSYDLEAVFDEYGWVEKELVQYFALMHVMTEIARDPKDGLCR